MAELAAPGSWKLGSKEASGSVLASVLRQAQSGTARSPGRKLGATGTHTESQI